jgi:hypothetical protein
MNTIIGFAIIRPDGTIQKTYDQALQVTELAVYPNQEDALFMLRNAYAYPGFKVVQVNVAAV